MGRRSKRKGGKARVVLICFLVLVLLAGGVVVGGWMHFNSSKEPVDPTSTEYISVNIPSGATVTRIGQILESHGLLRNPAMFRWIVRYEGNGESLRAGDFLLSKSMSTPEILHALTQGGAAQTMRFTVREGLTVREIAESLAADGLVDKERFIELTLTGTFDFDFMDELLDGPYRLEGFLFPETYDVFLDATEEDIINRMLTQWERVFTDEYRERAAELGLTMLEVMAIASLIEGEAQVAHERPKVSSVIHNRLAIGMQLQMCSTVQFALGERRDRLLFRDLEINHPYNTYIIPGLPPGPINSPGAASIHAALFPADTEYLFFVVRPGGGGTHNFARTHAEHQRFAAEYHASRN